MKLLKYSAFLTVILSGLVAFTSCNGGEEDKFNLTGTISYNGVEKPLKSGFWRRSYIESTNSMSYYMTSTTKASDRIGGREPQDYIEIVYADSIFGEEINIVNPPREGNYWIEIRCNFDYQNVLKVRIEFPSEESPAGEPYIVVEDDRRIHSGTVTFKRIGEGVFDLNFTARIDGVPLSVTFNGECKRLLYE